MLLLLSYLFAFVLFIQNINLAQNTPDNKILRRNKRYLVFPEGSSVELAICLTIQCTTPTEVWTQAINWGIDWELPNDTSSFTRFLPAVHTARRRNRRDLYQKIEKIMKSMGYDGRACILQALCESARFLQPKNNMLEEVIRIAFKYPLKKLLASEPEEHHIYREAHKAGKENKIDSCRKLYPNCPLSLIEMALEGLITKPEPFNF